MSSEGSGNNRRRRRDEEEEEVPRSAMRKVPRLEDTSSYPIHIDDSFHLLDPEIQKIRLKYLIRTIEVFLDNFRYPSELAIFLIQQDVFKAWHDFLEYINGPVARKEKVKKVTEEWEAVLRRNVEKFNPGVRPRTYETKAGERDETVFIGSVHPTLVIVLRNMPFAIVDMYEKDELHQTKRRIDAALQDIFDTDVDTLLADFQYATLSADDPYFGLVSHVAYFSGQPGFLYRIRDEDILTFPPAMYFLIGFSIYGKILLSLLPDMAHRLQEAKVVIYNQNMKSLAELCSKLTTRKSIQVFGPGAFGWLLLGIFTRCILAYHQFTTGENMQFRWTMEATPVLRVKTKAPFPNDTQDIVPPWDLRLDGDFTVQDLFRHPNRHKQTDTATATQMGLVEYIFKQAYNMFETSSGNFYTDKSIRRDIGSIIVKLVGIIRPQVRGGQLIDGNNIFWERLLDTPGSKLTGKRGNFILFSAFDTLRNRYLHGCVYRALNCNCLPNATDSPVYCTCPLPDVLDPVQVDDIPELCKKHGDKYIVFVVKISKNDSGKYNKEIVLLHFGTNYSKEGKVLFVSQPDWERVQGHCALWVPSPEKPHTAFDEYGEFLRIGAYNRVLHVITGNKDANYCPLCGERYLDASSWAHFIHHTSDFICRFCGLVYEKEDDLIIHVKYHCKRLPEKSAILLKDEPAEYTEKSDTSMWINVYADLESAIAAADEDGSREHINILIGWVDDYNKEVRIKKSISDFFNDILRLPTTDVRIYFHNGEGYDFHFIIRDLCDCRTGYVRDFSIVGDSGQKIRFFSVKYRGKNLHFRDSFAFVSESLEKWVESSKKSGCEFPTFNNTFDEYKRKILLRKNPFPYNAILSPNDLERKIVELWGWARCDICEELFCYKYSKEELLEFSNWLEEHYKACGWHTVGDYYKDYLKCDVAQLKDIMDFFAKNVQDEYSLNIHDYYGTPSLTWAAWLKQNKYPLEPITESKHYDVINSTIRGGQTGAMTRLYESEKEGGAMFDLDINSLYATVMLYYSYPCHDWREEHIPYPGDIVDFIERMHASGRSAFFEIDMVVKENPIYEDYVPVASKRLIKGCYDYPALNHYASEEPHCRYFCGLTQVYGEHPHYCCHSRNLLWYLQHDVITISHIWFILSGKDEPVFHDYVEHNLKKRTEYADDPIKKMLYKLLNNSLYGKTYEDETQRADYKIELTSKVDPCDYQKIRRVISEMGEWTLYEANKEVFKVNKPVYLGACITEFSKLWMYQMYYDKIRPHFPDCRVYYTDTDAITILFPTKVKTLLDVANELNTEEEQIIDTSNFSVIPTEKRHTRLNTQPGLFKSETGEHRILKFIGLRAKTYIMVCEDDFIKMSVKGCPMAEKSKLTWTNFYDVLFAPGEGLTIEFDAIRSKYHHVKSVRLSKIVLSADDKKRYICDDLIHTYPLFSSQHMEAVKYKSHSHQ